MKHENMDNIVSRVVVAYDAKTGEVMHIHEELIEVVAGTSTPTPESTPSSSNDKDLETEIREEARRFFPQRSIETLVVDPEDAPMEGMRFEVELACRKLRKIPDDRAKYLPL